MSSKIEWTDDSSNPIRIETGGHWCKKISEGCAGCYAEEINQSNYFSFASHLPYSGNPPQNLILDRDILLKWTRIKKPRSIFVCSMTDWCGDWVPMEWRLESLRAMEKSKANFLLLTKRADELFKTVLAFRNEKFRQGIKDYAPSNIRVGISAENQETWDTRAPYLNAIALKGWKTMVSFEPLISYIDLDYFDSKSAIDAGVGDLEFGTDHLDGCWGIIGGESGSGARDFHCEWAEQLLDQFDCLGEGFVPFVKQLGGKAFYKGDRLKTKDKKGGDISEFPPKLQVRVFPD